MIYIYAKVYTSLPESDVPQLRCSSLVNPVYVELSYPQCKTELVLKQRTFLVIFLTITHDYGPSSTIPLKKSG